MKYKKTKIFKYFFIASMFYIISCDHKLPPETKVILIDLEEQNKVKIKSRIKSTINLETNDSILIGKIDKIECFDDKIYILDRMYSKSLFVFSTNGEFINKTKIGRGPGEVSSPWAFYIDKKKKNIMLWDQNSTYMTLYDLELSFLNQHSYKNHLMQGFAKLGEDTFLAMSYKWKDKKKKKITTYSIYTENFNRTIKDYLTVGIDMETMSVSKPISQHKRTLFAAPWNYNVYEISNNELKSRYYWDFGKYSYRIDQDENNPPGDEIWGKIESGEIIGYIDNISESDNFIGVGFFQKKDMIIYFYSKSSHKAYELNRCFEDKSLPECHLGSTIKGDEFIAVVVDDDFGNKKVNDNPVLITFEIFE